MKNKIYFFLSYITFWLIFFIFCKIIFLLSNYENTSTLNFKIIIGIFVHGAKLDFSALGYILVLPVTVIIVTNFFRGNITYHIIKVYSGILIITFSILMVSDLVLYKYWKTRLDSTPLVYLKNPAEMLASLHWWMILIYIFFISLIAFVFLFLFNRYVIVFLKNSLKCNMLFFAFSIIFLPLLIIPIRGGFDTSPVNLSTAYFHTNTFANHAAFNLFWNFGYSFTNNDTQSNLYNFLESSQATENLNSLFITQKPYKKVIEAGNPNIILVIIESFTSKIIEPLGGLPGITPNFNALTKEGIIFKNFYANGDRSDKGIVSILSGFPATGKTSIMKFPDKTKKLPGIVKDLNELGYSSSFYYGGDINFFNLKSYLLNNGIKNITSKSNFGSKESMSNWGVPDHIIFNKVLDDLSNETDTPFFKIIFTLSNHEPFDIPVKKHFKGSGITNKFLNSAYYTDSCLGVFIKKLKKTARWSNTLLILVADHGIRYPGNYPHYAKENYSIPMLWLGGVIARDSIISTYGSQIDIAATLLPQLNMETNDYRYSKNLFSPSTKGFSTYAFNDGIGFLTDSIQYIYNHNSGEVFFIKGNHNKKMVLLGKSFLQVTYEDFLAK